MTDENFTPNDERRRLATQAAGQIEAICDSIRAYAGSDINQINASLGPGAAVFALVARTRELGQAIIGLLADPSEPTQALRHMVANGARS